MTTINNKARIIGRTVMVLALMLLTTTTAWGTVVASGNCGNGVGWKLDSEGTFTIYGNGSMDDYGNTVVPWISYGDDIQTVVIEDGVTSISPNSFYDSIALTSVTIGNSVTTIGNYAFWLCSALTSVTIGNSVSTIGNHAFGRCTSLTSVTFPNSVTSIGDGAFQYCSGLTSVTIPNSVTTIGNYAFESCTSLTSVTFPNSVSTIGPNAFNNTAWYDNQPDGLVYAGKVAYKYKGTMPEGTAIEILEGTLGITDYAFESCTSLTSVTIPNSVTSIGDDAFFECSGLTSVTIPNSVTSIGQYAFYRCTSLTSLTIGNSVTSIGQYAFYRCTSLTSLTIPNSVTYIGNDAFYCCTSLTSVTIGNSVTSIGQYAFDGCTSLTSVTIGNSVSTIGNYAFESCTSLTSVTIPNSVTSIGEKAFDGCTSLTSVTIGNSVTSIGNNAFKGCSGLTSVHISDLAAWCKIYFFVAENNPPESNPLKYAHHLYLNGTEITDLEIPNSVTSIGQYAFYGCSGLTTIKIPTTVALGDIGDGAFHECTNLKLVRMYNLGRGRSAQGKRIFPTTVEGIIIPALVADLQQDDLDDFSFMKHVFYENTKSKLEQAFHTAFNTTYDDNTTLFGIWGFDSDSRIHWYSTVTFDMQGVLPNTSIGQVWAGWDTVECPTAPTATGYDFDGWYADAACTQAFDFTAAVPGDMSIYAKWIPHTDNVITFDTDGKGTTPPSQTLTSGETVTVPAGQSYNDGSQDYVIKGWYTDPERNTLYDFSTKVDHTMTLYAKWVVATGHATITTTGGDSNCLVTLTDDIGQTYSNTTGLTAGIYTLTVTPASGYSFSGSYTLTNRSSHISDMPNTIAGSETKTYTLNLTEKDAAINVTFSTQPILTVTVRADDESVLSQVTWSAVNNQTPTTTYDNGDPIPVVMGGAVSTDFGIRLSVDLGTLSGYGFTATVTDRGNGTTTYKTSNEGASFLIQPYGSIDIDLYIYPAPSITLQDNADNSTTITENMHIAAGSITLNGRTLYKDGDWNTLCLPFSIDDFSGTPLEGATVKYLKTTKNGGTSLSDAGELTLVFTTATSITAGRAYIVKWTKPADYEGNESTYDISDPTFNNVTISSTEPKASISNDKKVTFMGCYSPVSLAANDKSILFLGAANTLHYAANDETLGALRAFVQIDKAAQPTSYVMNFGNGETSSGNLYIPGDANGDGQVTITDAVAIVNYILGNPSANFNIVAANVNGDTDDEGKPKITITDAVAVVNIILNSGSSSAPQLDMKESDPTVEAE